MVDDTTPVDLTACDREPIHIPGSIQPHGVLLVADRTSQNVRSAAGDVAGFLGRDAWLGHSLGDLLGDELAAAIGRLTESVPGGGYCGPFASPLGPMDVSGSFSGDHVLVEMEPSGRGVRAAVVLAQLDGEGRSLERAVNVQGICERAAQAFRRLTGFDRVMIYRFLEGGAGSVLAEDKAEDLPSFLHHHFPGSDIPVQARALYVRNHVRVIPDINYEAAPLTPPFDGPEPLDMSDCVLRSVSPVHLQYMKNMGVQASASVSIVKDGRLWGLVACHHMTPRHLPFDVRIACRALAGGVARQVTAREEAEAYRDRIRLRGFEDDIMAALTADKTLEEELLPHLDDLRRMMAADGAAVVCGRSVHATGRTPPAAAVRELAAWALSHPGQPVATHALGDDYPPAASFAGLASGLLAVTVSPEEPFAVLWFRAEAVEVVNWAGNPHKAVGLKPGEVLTPRTSFESWSDEVRGQARRWTASEVEAAGRLRLALFGARQRRRVAELNGQLRATVVDKEALLQQQDFLIKEANHRVQNSLQLVGSFLALQARDSNDEHAARALEEAQRRLTAVALVHRRLYRADQILTVDLSRYVEELVADLLSQMGDDWARQTTMDLSPVLAPTDRAVTVGLVLTELIINANKYAYGGKAGPLEITLEEHGSDLRLVVADQGQGKPSGSEGFGSRMMRAMIEQLSGDLEHRPNKPGLRAVVTAPIETPKVRV